MDVVSVAEWRITTHIQKDDVGVQRNMVYLYFHSTFHVLRFLPPNFSGDIRSPLKFVVGGVNAP